MKKPGIKSCSMLVPSYMQPMPESPSTYLLPPSRKATKEQERESKTDIVARREAAASVFSIALAQSKSLGKIILTSKFLRFKGTLMNSREKVALTNLCC